MCGDFNIINKIFFEFFWWLGSPDGGAIMTGLKIESVLDGLQHGPYRTPEERLAAAVRIRQQMDALQDALYTQRAIAAYHAAFWCRVFWDEEKIFAVVRDRLTMFQERRDARRARRVAMCDGYDHHRVERAMTASKDAQPVPNNDLLVRLGFS